MSSAADTHIANVLQRYGEPFGGNVWRVQGNAVIYHKTLERIAKTAKIRFGMPTILRAERDEAVIMLVGTMPGEDGAELSEWTIGEACVGTNYTVTGKQKAFVYAMAEKRAKDRIILKLINLHGDVYSEDEDDEFRGSRMLTDRSRNSGRDEQSRDASEIEDNMKRRIDNCVSTDELTSMMTSIEVVKEIDKMRDVSRAEVRDYAVGRYRSLDRDHRSPNGR